MVLFPIKIIKILINFYIKSNVVEIRTKNVIREKTVLQSWRQTDLYRTALSLTQTSQKNFPLVLIFFIWIVSFFSHVSVTHTMSNL